MAFTCGFSAGPGGGLSVVASTRLPLPVEGAAGAVLHYLGETHHAKLDHITGITRMASQDHVWMDRFTLRNLELFYSPAENAVTLLDIIDRTQTAMGGRMLKRWMAQPLKEKTSIEERHAVVQSLMEQTELLDDIHTHLKRMGDLERLAAKLATGKVNPRELISGMV